MPIYLRLTIDGERTEFSTQREIDPAKWNAKKGRATATKKEETRQLNSFLETMQAQIYEAQRALLNKGKEITVRSIRNKMLGIEEEVIDPLKDKGLMPVYREHIKHVSDLVGKEYATGTLKRFKAASLHWKLSCSTERRTISSCENSIISLLQITNSF